MWPKNRTNDTNNSTNIVIYPSTTYDSNGVHIDTSARVDDTISATSSQSNV